MTTKSDAAAILALPPEEYRRVREAMLAGAGAQPKPKPVADGKHAREMAETEYHEARAAYLRS